MTIKNKQAQLSILIDTVENVETANWYANYIRPKVNVGS